MLIRIRSQCQFILDCLIMSRKACLSFSVPCFRLLVYRTFFRPMREGGRRLNIGTRCSVTCVTSRLKTRAPATKMLALCLESTAVDINWFVTGLR